VIVPFAPGGGVDILTRAVAQELAQRWKLNWPPKNGRHEVCYF
jgi:tripartite-type tricarboxylate transporter receptor subunit TctC